MIPQPSSSSLSSSDSSGSSMDDKGGMDSESGFSITINCADDGTYTVTLSDSATESSADAGDEPQTAKSFDDALNIAREMYQAESTESGDDYGSSDEGSSGNDMMSPDDAKAAWNQLASKREKRRM